MLLSAISVLKNKKYTIDDATLWKSKAMLDSRMKDLQGQGLGETIHKEPLTLDLIEQASATIDAGTPMGLIKKVALILGKYGAFRGGDYYQLKSNQIKRRNCPDTGKMYFDIIEFIAKNNQRGIQGGNAGISSTPVGAVEENSPPISCFFEII
jgi:hypothetical protein